MTSKTYRCQGDGETLLVKQGPLLDSREVQGALFYRGTHKGTVGALNKTQINDQVRLE